MKKTIVLMIVITALAVMCSGCGRSMKQDSTVLEYYQIGAYSDKHGSLVLTLFENEESNKEIELKLKGQEDLAKTLYRYSGMLALNVTYASDKTILDYTVQDLFTGENYGKLNAKELYDTFDPARFDTVEKYYQKEIRLSELIPGVTYKYEDVNSLSDSEIINDTGQNVLVYYDDLPGHQSRRYWLFSSCISQVQDSELILPPPQKNYFMIRFQNAETDEMVRFYKDNMIRLSDFHTGDSFYVKFQTALYNDTGHEVTMIRTDGTEITILKDQLIRLDWNRHDFRTFESDFIVK